MQMNKAGAATKHNPGIMMPTNEQMTSTFKGIVESAQKNGTLEQLDGPPVADPNKWPRYDITPDGMMDLTKTVFNIKGDLYLQNSTMNGPNGRPHATWAKVGPAPMF